MREYEILPENGKERRHFKDDVIDIVVWKNEGGELYGFQLNYTGRVPGIDAPRFEDRVITYFRGQKMEYSYVPEDNRDIPTPKVLTPKDFENQNLSLATYIRQNSGEIPWSIVQFIVKELTKAQPAA